MRKLIFFTIFIPLLSFGQVWVFEEGGNPFDGQYRTAQITANNGEFPYHESKLVVNIFNNKKVNVYITDGGYFNSTSSLSVLWAFDNEPNVIYSSRYNSISEEGKTIFFEGIYTSDPYKEYNKFDLIEKLKSSSKATVRLKDAYGRNDISYSLSGSSKAIGFVFKDFIFNQNSISKKVSTNNNLDIKVKNKVKTKENAEPFSIEPNSSLLKINSYEYLYEEDTIYRFDYPVVGQVKREQIYFNNYESFDKFTQQIDTLFSNESISKNETIEFIEESYNLILYASKYTPNSITIQTKDGKNEILWSWYIYTKSKLDKFKSEINSQ